MTDASASNERKTAPPPHPTMLEGIAWLPLPVFGLAIILLFFARIDAVFNPHLLLPVLNILFLTTVSLLVAAIAAWSYLENRSRVILHLGSGALSLGIVAALAGFGVARGSHNWSVTVFNIGVFLSALFHLVGAGTSLSPDEGKKRASRALLPALYLLAAAAIGLISAAAGRGLLPVFYAEGQQPPLLRLACLWSAAGMFAFSAVLLRFNYGRSRSSFIHWYSLGLGLLGMGIAGVSLLARLGSPLNWAARGAQYLGGMYMLCAVIAAVRESGAWKIPLSRPRRLMEERLALLAETSGELLQTSDPQGAIDSICRRVMEHLDCQVFFNYLADRKKGLLHLNACAGIPEDEAKRIEWLEYGAAVCGLAARDGRRIIEECVLSSKEERTALVRGYGVRAYACHPLLAEGGRVIGTLSFGTRSRDVFSEDEISLMRAVANHVAAALSRMQRMEELREAEGRFRNVLDNSIDAAYRRDLVSDAYDYMSPSIETITGYSVEEFTTMDIDTVLRIIHPDDLALVDKQLQAVATSGTDFAVVEYRLKGKDGRYRWLSDSLKVLKDDEGRPRYRIGIVRDVTARKQAEEALRESEENFRAVADNISQLAWMADDKGAALWYNRRWYDYTGMTFEQTRDWGWKAVHHPDHVERAVDKFRYCLGAGVPWEDTFPLRGGDGDYRWFLSRAVPIRDGNGRIVRWFGTNTDITELKQKEEALHTFNRTLNALTRSSQAMTRAGDEQGFLNEVCRIIVEDCGHPLVWIGYAEKDCGRTIRPMAFAGFAEGYIAQLRVSWADTDRGRGPAGTAIRTGGVQVCRDTLADPEFAPWREDALARGYNSSIAIPLKDGTQVFGVLSIYSFQKDAFSPDEVRLLSELAGDLSFGIANVRSRAAQAQAEERLRRKEEEFRSLAENSPDSIARLDTELRHLYVNPIAKRVAGMDITGRSWREAGLPEEFLALWEPVFRRVIETGKRETLEHSYVTPGENGPKYLSSIIVPEFDGGGKVRSELIITRDVTELRTLTNDLERLAERRTRQLLRTHAELEHTRRMADIGRLASTIAHELRNPLSAIRAAAYNIRRKAKDNALERHLGTIDRKVAESDHIIQNLLAFSRVKSVQREQVRVRDLVRECAADVLPKYAGWEVRLEADIDCAEGETVEADGTQMKMLVGNILDNAYQSLPDKKGTITVRLRVGDEGCRLVVSDTGVGIEKSELERIFEPFHTTKSRGTGLGLAICREIVQLHRGTISVESEKGRGTTFTVTLPRQRSSVEREGGGLEHGHETLI